MSVPISLINILNEYLTGDVAFFVNKKQNPEDYFLIKLMNFCYVYITLTFMYLQNSMQPNMMI